VYTGPPTFKKSSEPAAATKPPPSADKKKVHHKNLAAGKGKEVQGPTSSSAVKKQDSAADRPAKKPRVAPSASVMHVQPLCDNDADDHNLMLSTLTGGHGIFMAHAEPQDAEWYDSDDDWYDPDDNFNASGDDDHQEQGAVDDYDSQLVDSDATVHIVPDHVVNSIVSPAPPSAVVMPPLPEGLPEMFGVNQLYPRPYGLRSSP
jgi:hypothetical protein